MQNQNMRVILNKMSYGEQRKLVEFIIQSNFKRNKPYIEHINDKGEMKVRFIERVPFVNFTLLNSTQISIYVKESEDQKFNKNLTWKCTGMKPKSMMF